MTWTKKRPKKIGYYWVIHPKFTPPHRYEIAKVSRSRRVEDGPWTWWVTRGDFRDLIQEYDGAWWYPIGMPDCLPEE
jgi:hypothetical protein